MPEKTPKPSERFFSNVVWSWFGVAVTLAAGFIVSPYLIRRLGHEAYGVWILVFGLIDYYWLFDLGFRSATVKYTAHYRATERQDKINEVINTGLVYFSAIGVVLFAGTVLLSRYAVRLFQVSPQYRATFGTLIVIVGVSWAFGTVFNAFNACLEGFQRFDLASRIAMATTAARTAGVLTLLTAGFGLVPLGFVAVAAQMAGFILSYFAIRRVFPELRLGLRYANRATLREMAGYGVHTFTATIGFQLLNQGPPLLIGVFRPAAFVGYFALPARLLQYAVDAVDRVGLVTGSNAAELTAKGDSEAISRLGLYINRYCLILFLPVTILVSAYGYEVLKVYVGAGFAAHSGPLFPILALGVTLGIASQYNSASILYGLGKHRGYARALITEGLILIATLFVVVPRWGLLAAAWAVAALMILNRGLFAPWLLCQALGLKWTAYMRSIYARPIAAALPMLAFAFWLKANALPGDTWFQILAAAALVGSLFFATAFFVALERNHRAILLDWLKKRLQRPVYDRVAAIMRTGA